MPGPDCTEDARRCSSGITHAARLVSAGQYADVQQNNSTPLQQDNLKSHRSAQKKNTSHLTVGGILNRHNHGHSYRCTYQVTRFDLQLHEQTHSPTFPSFHLRHSSFSNPSVASPTSQLILQPFFRFSYVTSSSRTSPGEPPMADMVLVYGEAAGNGRAVSRINQERYPHHGIPCYSTAPGTRNFHRQQD